MTEKPETVDIYIVFKVASGAPHREGPYRVTTPVLEAMLKGMQESYVNTAKKELVGIFDVEALAQVQWNNNPVARRPTKLIIRFEDVLMIG